MARPTIRLNALLRPDFYETALRIFLFAGISQLTLAGVANAATATSGTGHTSAAHHASQTHKKRKASGAKAPVTAAPVTAASSPAVATPVTTASNTKATVVSNSASAVESQGAESVVVTGSRLTQSRLTNVMAGFTVSGDQLQKRGYQDLGLALLRENTAFSIGNNSPIGGQGSFGAGQSFVSLLNLGSQRTLTLIDGMRMVSGATASAYGSGPGSQVDVSAIPTSLIKGIDTRLGGAGAAYGADAIAGVVNYQLDDHFKGVSLTAQGGWTQQLLAPSEKIAFKAGTSFDHDRGGVVFDVEYRNSGGMLANDMPKIFGRNSTSYAQPLVGQNTPYSYVMLPNQRYLQITTAGMPLLSNGMPVNNGMAASGVGLANAQGQALSFTPNGQGLVPLTYTGLINDNQDAVGGNGTAFQDYNQIYAPTNKLNLTTLGHYDITDHLHATWQGWYARGTAASEVAQGTWTSAAYGDDPLSLSTYHSVGDVNGVYTLSTNNPYLTSAERTAIVNGLSAAGQPTDTFYLTRLNQDLDAGMYQTTMQMYRFAGGLSGDFDAVGRHFNWKVRGEYSRYLNDTYQPSIVTQNLLNALNVTRDASGNIICQPGYQNAPIATRSSTCAPLNPFGQGQMTPAARDYVIANAHSYNSNAQRDIQAEISSTVLRLPAGDVRWDLGYEHRREGYNFNPGSFFSGWQGAGTDGAALQYGNSTVVHATNGAFDTHEAFGELDVPLVSPSMHVPGVYNLSAQAMGRYIHNSVTGSYWSYMFGGSWWPTQDFGLSGNYAQSVRNPSVGELYAPETTDYEYGTDPCSSQGITQGPNPAIRAANCAKAGITQPFSSNFNYYTIKGKSSGNPHLKNEVSKSYTGTLTFRPHFVRGLNFEASFMDVKLSNAITDLEPQSLMDACYDSASYPNNQYCNTFTRDSSGQLSNFHASNYNIAQFETQALQANLQYNTPLSRFGLPEGFGEIGLHANYIHYLRSQQSYLSNVYLLSGTTGSPNDRFTMNMNYTRGPLSVQWQTIWYAPTHYAVQVPADSYEFNHRPSFAYHNVTVGYDITKNFNANFMINNIMNSLPKYPGTVSENMYYEALIGRSFEMQLGAHF